jgi:YVTN family beta-propeller protein
MKTSIAIKLFLVVFVSMLMVVPMLSADNGLSAGTNNQNGLSSHENTNNFIDASNFTNANQITDKVYNQSIMQSNSTSNYGYVKYTLDLLNNSLIHGNFTDTGNGVVPYSIAYDPSNGYLYVANGFSENITVINSLTNKVLGGINIRDGSTSIAYDSSNGHLYVAGYGGVIVVINSTTDKVINSINVFSHECPDQVLYDSSNGNIYLSGAQNGPCNIIVLNGTTNKIMATIPVGGDSSTMAYDPSNGNIYRGSSNGNVSVLNTATNQIIDTIPVGGVLSTLAYDPSNGNIYIDSSNGNVSVLNTATNQIIDTIPVGGVLSTLAYDPSNGYIYIGSSNGNVSVLNTATNQIIDTIPVGGEPLAMAYDSLSGNIYVSNVDGNMVLINSTTNKVVNTIAIGRYPGDLVYSPYNGDLYFNAYFGIGYLDNISVISSSRNIVIKNVSTCYHPLRILCLADNYQSNIVVNPSNGYIYIGNPNGNVSVLNTATNKIIDTILIGGDPSTMAYDPSNGNIYIGSSNGNVSVLNTATNHIIDTISARIFASSMAYDPSNGNIYIGSSNGNLSVLNTATNQIIATIPVGGDPSTMAYDPSNGNIYIGNSNMYGSSSGNVSVLNTATNQIIDTIEVCKDGSINSNTGYVGSSIAYDPLNGYLYVANEFTFNELGYISNGNVSVINTATNKIMGTITVGKMADSIAYDPLNGYVYVSNDYSGTISILSTPTTMQPQYSVKFVENGLNSGTSWSVTLNGQTESSTTSTIVFTGISNGTYSYKVSSVSGYNIPSSGSITVDGSSVTKAINFSPLPPPVWAFDGAYTDYNMSITNNSNVATTNVSVKVIAVNSINDTVEISITDTKDIFNSTLNSTEYLPWNNSNSLLMFSGIVLSQLNNGTFPSNPNLNVSTSVKVNTPAGTFLADRLYGQIYNVNISAYYDMYSGVMLNLCEGNLTFKDVLEATATNIPEGNTYISSYPTTFKETGLPNGTTWYVNLTNGITSGPIKASSYTFYLTNGTYSFTASGISKYYVSNGTLTVAGRSLDIPVNYMKYAYLSLSVAPSSANVSINGHNVTLINGKYSEYAMQGYYYITVTEPGYKPYSNLVYLSYNGIYSYNISLTPITVYGYLTGTVLPGNATITANGIGIPVMNGYFNVSLAPGTYYITVTAPGYNGNISVERITQGKVTPLTVKLSKLGPTVKTVTVSGYVSQVNASVTVNGISAYVNSTGYYSIAVPSGNVIISAYESGYYPYSKTVDLKTSQAINIALIKQPKATSTETVSGITSSGYNVTVTNLTINNGYISMDYNATVNGTVTVMLPYNEIRNATIADILSSRVYIDGTLYTDFAITVTSNGSAVLTVYNLAGDPALYWKYSPAASLPQYYNVTFTETGLPSGTTWSVTLNGQTESSTTSTIVFTGLSNGTYSYTVSSVSGYTLSPSSGSINIHGSNTSKSITFAHNPSKKTPFKLSTIDIYAIIGAVVAIAAIGGAVMIIRRRR